MTPAKSLFAATLLSLTGAGSALAQTTLFSDNFSGGTTTGWKISHERLNEFTGGAINNATLSVSNVAQHGGNAMLFASTANFKSAQHQFSSVTLAIGESLTLSADYSFGSAWNNANGLWFGFANSAQTVLRDTAQPDSGGNRTYAAFYAMASPAGAANSSFIRMNQGSGAGSTNLSTTYGTAASGVNTSRSVTMTFERISATELKITSDLGRFGMVPATVTGTVTTDWFTFDTIFVVKGGASLNNDLYLDNVSVSYTAVPEPSSFALIGAAGALTFAGMRRRRRAC